MPSTRVRRLLACLGLALLSLGLLPSPAGAVGLLDRFAGAGSAEREEAAAAAPASLDVSLWNAVWGFLEGLGLAEPPPAAEPSPDGPTMTDDDQGVTLDPNG